MPQIYHVGQRVSLDSAICTVRYIGPVEGTSKEWIGVEWDDPSRGKHSGEHEGVRYFNCLSQSPKAASFIRPSRPSDPEQSFVDAVQQKYASDVTLQPPPIPLDKPIEISGKVVEEVGFDKVKQKLAQLHQLKIVLVDGFRIKSVEVPETRIRDVCPSIAELDLSRNLFEGCSEIVQICGELTALRSLRLNGNRLRVSHEDITYARQSCQGIEELELDEMLLSWEELGLLVERFDSLTSLTASLNCFKSIPGPLRAFKLTSLKLEFNEFTSLSDLAPLSSLQTLERLYLKGNQISKVADEKTNEVSIYGQALHYVDLSYNDVYSWRFVDELVACFPGLDALRFSNNPVYERVSTERGSPSNFEEGFMFTVARIGRLATLNFSNISPAERTNAEMFYLSRVAKELADIPESEESRVTAQHRRYTELCEIYGAPEVPRKQAQAINPDFLEARLIKFTFCLPANSKLGRPEAISKMREIPKSFDVYRVKGIVARMFDLKPRKLRLIWETGEWDPVAGYEDVGEDSSDEEDADVQNTNETGAQSIPEKGKWMKREVEIEDSTRQVGFCVDGDAATVRIEIR